MLPFEDRWTRQRQLPEVGAEGQKKLSSTKVLVAPGVGSWVQLEYLRRAGVETQLGSATPEREAFVHEGHFSSVAASELGIGAWRALQVIRRVLGAAANGATAQASGSPPAR